jgi:hypothetical protein
MWTIILQMTNYGVELEKHLVHGRNHDFLQLSGGQIMKRVQA